MNCRKYIETTIQWTNMLLHNSLDKTITDARELIKECLNCYYHKEQWCRDWDRLIKFLDDNLKK
jgi:hypothetical protein